MPVWVNDVIGYARKHRLGCTLFSLVAALSFAMGSRLSIPGAVTDPGISIKPINLSTVLVFSFSLVGIFVLLVILGAGVEYSSHRRCDKKFLSGLSDRGFLLVVLLVLCICWLPYFLACYPGGVFSDSFNAIRQAVWGGLNNQQPILYTLLIKLFIEVSEAMGHGLTVAVAGFCAAQYVAMAIESAVILRRIRAAQLPKMLIIIAMIFFAFFPLVPAYSVSIWKDVPFTLALVAFALALYDASKATVGNDDSSRGIAVRLAISGLLVAFFRNNGKFILVLCLAIFAVTAYARKTSRTKPIAVSLVSLFVVTVATFYIQGPVYSRLAINDTETTESVAIPVQQIAAISNSDGNMTADERAYVDTFLDAVDAKKYYNPCLFDMIKWYAPSYSGAAISSNMGKFISTWGSLVLKNPSVAFDAYALETCGFWAPNVATGDGYISVKSWYNEFGLENADLFERLGIYGVSEAIQSIAPISAGIFAWIMLAILAVAIMQRNVNTVLGILPLLALWLTVMIATPVAVSLRYVYAIVFAAPLEMYFLLDRNKFANILKEENSIRDEQRV